MLFKFLVPLSNSRYAPFHEGGAIIGSIVNFHVLVIISYAKDLDGEVYLRSSFAFVI